jgi:uncharacterized protein (DUF1697 family)
MPSYVAFLGGINVGGHRVKMDRLRSLFEELQLRNVSTFIASGNVLFSSTKKDTAKLEAAIEQHLETSLGYRVPVFLRTNEELAAALRYEPFDRRAIEDAGHRLHICFRRGPWTEAELAILRSATTPMDELHGCGREMYWLFRGNKITESLLKWPSLNKKMGASTARNVTMLRRLLATISH